MYIPLPVDGFHCMQLVYVFFCRELVQCCQFLMAANTIIYSQSALIKHGTSQLVCRLTNHRIQFTEY